MMALMHPRVRSNVLINIGSWRAHRRSTGAAITRGAGRWPPATHKNSKAARKRVHISTMAYTRLTNTSAPSPSVGQSRRCPWLVVPHPPVFGGNIQTRPREKIPTSRPTQRTTTAPPAGQARAHSRPCHQARIGGAKKATSRRCRPYS